nr:MAG TPA: Hydrogen maturase F tetramerization domain protein [Caudoviricetes sp.]
MCSGTLSCTALGQVKIPRLLDTRKGIVPRSRRYE